jgi:hypothetical protein
MENNLNYYNTAAHLIEASSWIKGIDNDLSNFLLTKAEELIENIVVMDDEEVERVKEYEQLLKSK